MDRDRSWGQTILVPKDPCPCWIIKLKLLLLSMLMNQQRAQETRTSGTTRCGFQVPRPQRLPSDEPTAAVENSAAFVAPDSKAVSGQGGQQAGSSAGGAGPSGTGIPSLLDRTYFPPRMSVHQGRAGQQRGGRSSEQVRSTDKKRIYPDRTLNTTSKNQLARHTHTPIYRTDCSLMCCGDPWNVRVASHAISPSPATRTFHGSPQHIRGQSVLCIGVCVWHAN